MTKNNRREEKVRIFRLDKKLTPYKSAIKISFHFIKTYP